MTNISNFNINQNLLHKDINVSKKTDVNTIEKDKNFDFQKINTDFNIRPFISLDVENYREKQQKRLERYAR